MLARPRHRSRPFRWLVVAVVLASVLAWARAARAASLPSGFQEEVVLSGLTKPTAVQFAPNGWIVVAEKSGVIKIYESLADATPTVFADLRTATHNYWDRGLLGLALHPDFPRTPYVYVLYTLDAAIGGTPPRWGSFGGTSDPCPSPPGATTDGCVTAGRVSRLEAAGTTMVGSELVLLENWCQQYPSHSIGTIAFGNDGALYVSGGDGASFTFVDYGQKGTPQPNPCGDPPAGVGGTESPPSAEGGALRSQDLRTSGDAVDYDGTILRLDPLTGEALPDNPLAGGPIVADDRIVAYGLRNPFRMTPRPGTRELWIGDVGWNTWEEIDRVGDTVDTVIENFGWPCYEGVAAQAAYAAAGLDLCDGLFASPGAATDPYYQYRHGEPVAVDESCATGSSSISGLAFYAGGAYPSAFEGALFFADYSRNCIWAMPRGPSGDPDPDTRAAFVAGAANPVDLKIGPGGDLFYVDLSGGTLRRIRYVAASQPPVAVLEADRTTGGLPLRVQFDGSASTDPDPGDTLAYAWDLDGDGSFDDSAGVAPVHTYTTAGHYTVALRVTDPHGATDTARRTITAGNTRPTATISTPLASTTWQAGGRVAFAGTATDPEDGTLSASALTWTLVVQHCPASCHQHTIETFEGVASGTFVAPDHDYPTFLELRLTATDGDGLSDTQSVILEPATVDLAFVTEPPGLTLVVGATPGTTPFGRRVIVGSLLSIAAPSPQVVDGRTHTFASWSDGGPRSHDVTVPAAGGEYRAAFSTTCGACDDGDPCTRDVASCEQLGTCLYPPAPDGTACDDGDGCTSDDVCVAGTCVGGAPAICTPPVATLEADVSVRSGDRTKNFGTSGVLEVDASSAKQAFLRFAVSGLVGQRVTSAALRLQVGSASSAASNSGGRVYRLLDCGWSERATTWDTRPAIAGSPLATLGAVKRNQAVAFDVTPALTDGDGYYCFALDSLSSDQVSYNSREATSGRPVLVIAATCACGSASGPTPVASPTPAMSPTPAPAATAAAIVEADVIVDSSQPSINAGASQRIGADASPAKLSFLRVRVTGVGARSVTRARLRVQVGTESGAASDSGGRIRTVAACDWDEATLTWNTRPALGPEVASAVGPVVHGQVVELDVTPAVRGDGVVCVALDTISTNGVDYRSREASGQRPEVVLELQ